MNASVCSCKFVRMRVCVCACVRAYMQVCVHASTLTLAFESRAISRFVNRFSDSSRKMPQDFRQLASWLSQDLEDDSPTSYLAQTPVARFWRTLVEAFPSMLDFFVKADEVRIEQFLGAIDLFYLTHYISSTETKKAAQLFSLVRKRDRPSLCAWFARASPKQRRVFKRLMIAMSETEQNKEQTIEAALESMIYQDGEAFEDIEDRIEKTASVLLQHQPADRNTLDKRRSLLGVGSIDHGSREESRRTSANGTVEKADHRAMDVELEMLPFHGSGVLRTQTTMENKLDVRPSKMTEEQGVASSIGAQPPSVELRRMLAGEPSTHRSTGHTEPEPF